MFSKISSNDDSHGNNFYYPLSVSGYLTPLQRKKLREKRNINICSIATPKIQKKIKRTKLHKIKSQNSTNSKIKRTKKVLRKGLKENLPEERKIASDLLVQKKEANVSKEKRFFKSRSPQHLKKANYVVCLKSKRRRLNFSDPVRQNISSPKEQTENMYYFDPIDDTVLIQNSGVYSLLENSKPMKYVTERISVNCNGKVKNKGNLEKEAFEFEFHWPSDEYLLERQNKARAALKQAKADIKSDVVINIKENVEDVQHEQECSQKLYAIFTKPLQQRNNEEEKKKKLVNKGPTTKKSPPKKKCSDKKDEQMIIDAGQKEIGAKICPTCNMIYFIGQEEDEKLHSDYHDTYLMSLKFPGWKKENIVGSYDDGRIILIRDTDKNFKLKKMKDILLIANRDLGFPSAVFPTKPNVTFLLFISNERRVCGCLVAESIKSASPVVAGSKTNNEGEKSVWKLGNWYASSKTLPAMCGINRIWVSKDFRRRRVASRMIDCLRQYFIFGHIISLAEIAFTDPSPDGREFAASYTGTNHFLVYK